MSNEEKSSCNQCELLYSKFLWYNANLVHLLFFGKKIEWAWSNSSRDLTEKMDDKDSKPAPSLSPATGTSAASTSKGGTKRLADKLSAQVKNYVDTGSGKKALEATLHFIKANSLRHNDAGKTFGSSGTAGVLEALLSLTGQSSKGEEIEGLQCLAWSTLANLCAIDRKLQEKVNCKERLLKCSIIILLSPLCFLTFFSPLQVINLALAEICEFACFPCAFLDAIHNQFMHASPKKHVMPTNSCI